MPAVVMFNVLRSYCEGMGRTTPILLISLIALPVNIVGNYALGFGAWGCPRLGCEGLGYASAISMWVMSLGLAMFALWHPDLATDRLFARWEWPRWRSIGHLVWVGGPIGVSLFFECTLFGVVALILGKLGPEVVSANQIALNLASVTFMIPLGLAMAVTVRVGRAIGAGDNAAARRTGLVGNVLCVGFMSCAALAMALFPDFLTRLYTSDARVLEVARQLLFCAAIFQVFDGLQVSGAGALRGLKDTRAPMLITVVAYWCVGIPTGYYLGVTSDWGPQGLWTGLIGSLIAAATLLNARFYLRVGHTKPDVQSSSH
jgi:multidrug resistance protein, MATE family